MQLPTTLMPVLVAASLVACGGSKAAPPLDTEVNSEAGAEAETVAAALPEIRYFMIADT